MTQLLKPYMDGRDFEGGCGSMLPLMSYVVCRHDLTDEERSTLLGSIMKGMATHIHEVLDGW